MSTNVYPQFFTSQQPNAPQMSGAIGSEGQMLQILDAALVTGMCPNTAVDAVIEGDLIRINFGVVHGYMRYQFIDIEGATATALNGKHRILEATNTTIFIAKADITDVSGTLTTKLSPLDWENMFGTNNNLKRAYRSKDLTSTRTVLYLDSSPVTGTGYNASNPLKRTIVNACKDMVVLGEQIESYTAKGNIGEDGSYHWIQAFNTKVSTSPSTSNSQWVIVGDGKIFYFLTGYLGGNTSRACYLFGDVPASSASDKFNCLISFSRFRLPSAISNSFPASSLGTPFCAALASHDSGLSPPWVEPNLYFISDLTGTKELDYCRATSTGALIHSSETPRMTSGQGVLAFYSPLSLGLSFADIVFYRTAGGFYGGTAPYLRFILNNVITAVGTALDLKIHNDHLCVAAATSYTNYSTDNSGGHYGCFAFDLLTPRKKDVLV